MGAIVPTWSDKAAVATVAQAAFLVLALVYAARQLREAKRSRESQERPFVVVEADVERVRGFVHLVIRNTGPSIARSVRLRFVPPLETSHGRVERSLAIQTGLSSLAPGGVVVLLLDNFRSRRAKGLAETYEVTVVYQGDRKRWFRAVSYEEKTTLELNLLSQIHYIDRKNIHHVHERLDELVKIVGSWGAGGGGIWVRSDDDLDRQQDEWLAELEDARVEREAKQDGIEAGTVEGPPPV